MGTSTRFIITRTKMTSASNEPMEEPSESSQNELVEDEHVRVVVLAEDANEEFDDEGNVGEHENKAYF